tara:strand:- start:317 stop:493 length:177 start_codon:yes stop_codon:yes gene_type:complete
MINRWVAKVVADPDDPNELCLDFPDELLEEMGWVIGDELEFVEEDGRWIIKKVEGKSE